MPSAFAQSKDKNRTEQSSTAICRNSVYLFKFNDRIYKDGDKAYVCPVSLPDTIQVIDTSGAAITFSTTWNGADPIGGDPSMAKLELSHFNGDKASVDCSFTDGSAGNHYIEIHIIKKVHLGIGAAQEMDFAFDSNRIAQYPTYHTPFLPFKFLESGHDDDVMVKLKPKKALYAANLSAADPLVTITPETLSASQQNINLSLGTLGVDTFLIDVHGCSTDPELRVFAGKQITKSVDFVYLCDSTGCPATFPIESMMTEANEVLNKTGLYLTLGGVYYDTVAITLPILGTVSYDFSPKNGIFNAHEQFIMHGYYMASGSLWTSDYLVMLVPDLGLNDSMIVAGRATGSSEGLPEITKSMSLDVKDCTHGSTLAHEIGHAAFALWHPESTHGSNPNPSVLDKRNFMYGTSVGRTNNIRAYQMSKIHMER